MKIAKEIISILILGEAERMNLPEK